ncbi:hypothetical protein MIND_00911400 [Mycena indigotica]|uniref:Uncharacterized protein n=1 Tax=Mycena indigotica TaxID=2126181 RepID=A0A8H6VWP2_9AGAR|nr:uncharacterized protein MIND_00911400 [Mycena indigotica]KAF7296804.1 hypothetical protein MIND_00911400 [Mycena indigotica]
MELEQQNTCTSINPTFFSRHVLPPRSAATHRPAQTTFATDDQIALDGITACHVIGGVIDPASRKAGSGSGVTGSEGSSSCAALGGRRSGGALFKKQDVGWAGKREGRRLLDVLSTPAGPPFTVETPRHPSFGGVCLVSPRLSCPQPRSQ